MFKVEDIVTPKEIFTGNGIYFKVVGVERKPMDNYLYKLKNIEQDKCHTIEELNEIKVVEATTWEENELDLIEPMPETTVKLKGKNLFDTCVQGNPEGITIRGDSSQPITVQLSDEIIKWSTTSIDSSGNVLQSDKKICTINKKEENEMKILDLYKERKTKAIEKEYLEAKEIARKDDEIQKIILEMTDQVNTILKNQNKKITYEFEPNLITLETEIKIDKLKDKRHEELEKLRSTLEEIRALLELTDDYNERIKILKNYDILDRKGKLNI